MRHLAYHLKLAQYLSCEIRSCLSYWKSCHFLTQALKNRCWLVEPWNEAFERGIAQVEFRNIMVELKKSHVWVVLPRIIDNIIITSRSNLFNLD